MNKGKGRVTRMRIGRVLLSYGIVFTIGLWLGYKVASTRKAATPERKEMLESIEGQGEAKRSEGNNKAGGETLYEGEVAQRDDLSLTFYETLLKKEPFTETRNKTRGSKETQAAAGPREREGLSKEDKSSERALSRDAPFTIQVGSFAHKKQAEDLTRHLRGKGYPAYIRSQVISGMGRMYQVRIGRYRTLHEAKREAKHIGERERLPTYIPPLSD